MRAGAIRQRRMRSESDGHCAPRSFPGLAVRAALRRKSPVPLVESWLDRYRPSVDEFLEHVEEVRVQTGWDESFRLRRVARVSAVDGWTHALTAAARGGVASDATSVYVMNLAARFVALDAETGAVRWSHDLGDPSVRWSLGVPVVHHGRVYAGSAMSVHAFTTDGVALWSTALAPEDWAASWAGLTADADTVVIAATNDRALALSGRLAGGMTRVGAAEKATIERLGVRVIDASSAGWGIINHDLFLSNAEVRRVIRRAIDTAAA